MPVPFLFPETPYVPCTGPCHARTQRQTLQSVSAGTCCRLVVGVPVGPRSMLDYLRDEEVGGDE
jgi:hypothetical protein